MPINFHPPDGPGNQVSKTPEAANFNFPNLVSVNDNHLLGEGLHESFQSRFHFERMTLAERLERLDGLMKLVAQEFTKTKEPVSTSEVSNYRLEIQNIIAQYFYIYRGDEGEDVSGDSLGERLDLFYKMLEAVSERNLLVKTTTISNEDLLTFMMRMSTQLRKSQIDGASIRHLMQIYILKCSIDESIDEKMTLPTNIRELFVNIPKHVDRLTLIS